MTYTHSGEGQQSQPSTSRPWSSGTSSSDTRSPEWSEVVDPAERRKIQNKLAQQRFSRWLRSMGHRLTANTIQEPKQENNEKTRNVSWRIDGKQRVHTHLQTHPSSKITTLSQVSPGEGYLSDTLWQQGMRGSGVRSKARGRILSTPCEQEGAAGELSSVSLCLLSVYVD